MKRISVVYTTIDSIEKARKLARNALKLEIAACVNIVPGSLSIYSWEGKIEESQECFLLFKTRKTKAEKLKEWLIENHPYTTPAILDGEAGINSNFFDFVEEVVEE